jgi:hypothetical protein
MHANTASVGNAKKRKIALKRRISIRDQPQPAIMLRE